MLIPNAPNTPKPLSAPWHPNLQYRDLVKKSGPPAGQHDMILACASDQADVFSDVPLPYHPHMPLNAPR